MTSGRLDWVCIGAQKAGTTTLFRVLRQHPRLLIPPGKEDPLFDREVSAAEVERYLEERFAGAPAGVRCGTVTPPYMSSRATAARLHRFAPDARVVVLLRDPVSRAFSHYRMSVRRGIENRSFSEAIGAQLESLDRGAAIDVDSETATYVERGRYGHILAPWWELFGPEGIHVELLADLNARPAEVFGRVQCFLGVEPQVTGLEELRAHPDPPAHRLRRARRPVAAALRKLGVLDRLPVEPKERFVEALERGLARLLPAEEEQVPAETEARIRAHLAPDRERLVALLGRQVPWT